MSHLDKKAEELYLYGFPMVITEVTHWGTQDTGFEHFREFPTDKDKRVVKLNNDTLYSFAWTQLSKTPYVIHIPKIEERYFLFPIMDAYTNVFESIGTRTPLRCEGDYIMLYQDDLIPQGYEDHEIIRCKDSLNTILLRIETRGKKDYTFVNQLQDLFSIKPIYPERVEENRKEKVPIPYQYVEYMSEEDFFSLFAELAFVNPIRNESVLHDFIEFGYEEKTGKFNYSSLDDEHKSALLKGKIAALQKIKSNIRSDKDISRSNNWSVILGGVGNYGTDYLRRATTAFSGWGANIVEDSAYAVAASDIEANPLNSKERYQLHFNADEYPHAAVFWSVTLYGEPSKFMAPNIINRFVINSYDLSERTIEKNADGSLDIFIQRNQPTDEKEKKNWLPAPANEEHFSLAIRIYWPDKDTLEGKWNAPIIERRKNNV